MLRTHQGLRLDRIYQTNRTKQSLRCELIKFISFLFSLLVLVASVDGLFKWSIVAASIFTLHTFSLRTDKNFFVFWILSLHSMAAQTRLVRKHSANLNFQICLSASLSFVRILLAHCLRSRVRFTSRHIETFRGANEKDESLFLIFAVMVEIFRAFHSMRFEGIDHLAECVPYQLVSSKMIMELSFDIACISMISERDGSEMRELKKHFYGPAHIDATRANAEIISC